MRPSLVRSAVVALAIGGWVAPSDATLQASKPLDQQLLDAAKAGNARRITDLAARGADPDARNADGWPAIVVATAEGHLAAVRALLAAKANVDLADEGGDTPLHYASLWGQTEIVLALIESGADATRANGAGITALMTANNAAIAKALLDAGADVDARDVSGETALIWKCNELGDAEIVKLLIQAKADLNVVPGDGRGALRRAREAKRSDLVALLREAGAKQ